MRRRPGIVALLASALAAAACASVRGDLLVQAPYPLLRIGPERHETAYDDPRRALKLALLDRINRERAAEGAPPLRYEPQSSLVGDAFCFDAALHGTSGHWDVQGRAPYVRFGLAGGVDFHVQNVSTYSTTAGRLGRSLEALLFEAHDGFMAERPPNDGHRRAVLDPTLTHVGIGMGSFAGEFRMSEEFTRVALEWLLLPEPALRVGETAYFAARPLPGFSVAFVEVRREPPPVALAIAEVNGRGAYRYPEAARTLWPGPPRGFAYAGNEPADFEVRRDGAFGLSFALDRGPGLYLVVAYVRRGPAREGPAWPASAALVTALP